NMKRREFCTVTGSAFGSLMLGSACRPLISSAAGNGRLSARIVSNVKPTVIGKLQLSAPEDRDPILPVPAKTASSAVPLLVFLHGAGQNASQMLEYLGSVPEETGVAVLAANSIDYTWDAVHNAFGPDVQSLNSLLTQVFQKLLVDSLKLALGGFSDG